MAKSVVSPGFALKAIVSLIPASMPSVNLLTTLNVPPNLGSLKSMLGGLLIIFQELRLKGILTTPLFLRALILLELEWNIRISPCPDFVYFDNMGSKSDLSYSAVSASLVLLSQIFFKSASQASSFHELFFGIYYCIKSLILLMETSK